MTDTFGRLMWVVYQPKMPETQCSILGLRDQCRTQTSLLRGVLYDTNLMKWIAPARDLRGRCQHSDVSGVLIDEVKAFGTSTEPIVDAAYSWAVPPTPTPIVQYARNTAAACEELMAKAVQAVLATHTNPF